MNTLPTDCLRSGLVRRGHRNLAAAALWVLLLVQLPLLVRAEDRQWLPRWLPAAATNAPLVRPLPRWQQLNFTIGLPLRNRPALTNLLHQLYDPASTNYHHFLTPDQFAQSFGPTPADYAAVINFARTNGLVVTARHANRTLVSLRGRVGEVERTLHLHLNEYQHPTESRTFRAPDAAPSLDLAVPVLSVNGLDDYVLPHPCLQTQPAGATASAATGSGPSGTYLGNDFRSAYTPGVTLTGTGQTVGLLEFDSGYYPEDIAAYEALAGLPNVPVSADLLDGYSGAAGSGNIEVSLDIEMAIAMAPGLNGVLVYEGSTTDDILNRMATDNRARQLSASWTYPIDPTSDQIFLQFAAQGQSFFNASGDSDADVGAPASPTDDPNITIVGGTTLTTTGPAGSWVGETVWNRGGGVGSSGGISTSVPIPPWQTGIDMSANLGSTTLRNLPDVAMVADNVYVAYGNGHAGAVGGTSCATPLWATLTALINELALTNHQPAMGFLNPAVYALGKGSNVLSYASLFHDVTNGNNESASSPGRYPGVPGYDLCTGWGTPQGSNLISALALPEPLVITPAIGVLLSGPVGGPFLPAMQDFSLNNQGTGTLNWSLVNTSAWFNVGPLSGSLSHAGPATLVGVGATLADNALPAGNYTTTLWFTNLTDNFGQSRTASLAVVTPPVITTQPASQAVLEGLPASFTVGIGTNALMYYQWQENGTNLADQGNISGSATSTLTISQVTFTNVAAYSVILSNAAGVLASSPALLTIVPSAPVILQQPVSQTVLPGAPATFNVSVAGNEPYAFQWQLNGTNLVKSGSFSGITSSALTVNHASAATVGIYSVAISNSLGQVTSIGAGLSLIPITPTNVTFTSLASFASTVGTYPYSGLTQGRDGNFYGTTTEGGIYRVGNIFKITTNGTLTSVFAFNDADGAIPYGGLILAQNGAFYGTCDTGGAYADGTTFSYVSGGAFTLLTSFNGNNGMYPVSAMVQGTDTNYYGIASEGGPYGYGTVFRLSGLVGDQTTLVAFDGNNGAYPSPILVQGSDGNFYGTTENGGTNGGNGTVFKLSPAGQLTTLYAFSGLNDGGIPVAGLVAGVDGNFYGTTYLGGTNGSGTVFKITPGGALTTLWSFTGGNDGAEPWGGLVQALDGNLYGTTQIGGVYGAGTLFQISPGGNFATLVQFDGFIGSEPTGNLVQGTDGNLYGTTQTGGSSDVGTVFRLSINGPLQITGQPVDQPVYVGDNAVFTVATDGSSPVYYQWQQDGINLTNGSGISGANSATLVISNVNVFDAAIYSVIVSNAFNSVSSADAYLEVIYSPPDLLAQPVSQTTVTGTTVTFSVNAVGDGPLGYQWAANGFALTNGGNISGALTSTLVLANVTPANAAAYSVKISNGLFAVSSTPATLTVVPPASPGAALTSLFLFTGGSDGAFPYAGLVQGQDNNLYGTTAGGGASYQGATFRLSLAGTMSTLHSFAYGTSGGEEPYAPLVQGTNSYFYGNTYAGGSKGYGTLYQMSTAGAVTSLYNFTDGSDGANPQTGLAVGADGSFYGTILAGGPNALGSIYRLTASGIFTNVWSFSGDTNGSYPDAALTPGANGLLYGTAAEGGANGVGTVFSLTTNGTLVTLAAFSETNGALPEAGVTAGADGRLYGTTAEGGANGYGTVFSLATNGSLTTLYSFGYTNGAYPGAALAWGVDGNLYGTTSAGGSGGQGTVFKITTNGVLTTLVWFDGLNGASPQAALVQATNGIFYGTTPEGGTGYNPSAASGGNGTIFTLTVPTFLSNPLPAPGAIACLPYNGSLTSQTVAPAGDPLTFAKVSGPAWLSVAASGRLAGTPTNADIGTNRVVVSLTDANGISANATLQLVVAADPPPYFLASPLTEPWAVVDEDYAGSLATNATSPYFNAGDRLAFGKVSGPAWLNVAPNGTLSGTPEGTDGGTNTFVVSVTGLGGASNTATLYLYVALPPAFASPVLAGAPAAVGIPYNSTLLTNTLDPAGAAGDMLTFYKVTGPAWLTVATNGALSGTPASANLGANSFLVLVVDSVGLSAIGTLDLTVRPALPPAFLFNPFVVSASAAGQPFSMDIAALVANPNPGDTLNFAKISGPAWLTLTTNGTASGTPYSINGGTNTFVFSAADLAGLTAQATFIINITTVPVSLSIARQGAREELFWSGGIPPWQVQSTTNLNPPVWQNLGAPTTVTNRLLVPASPATFYRVQAN